MNRIESPRTDDNAIEQEIKAKGLTAPRVTPADIEANIVGVDYVKHVSQSGQVLRWAVLNTRCGFAVTGDPSVAVSPANDDAEIGEKVALANAKNTLWPLMGYALKEKLAATPSDYRERVRLERERVAVDLMQKVEALLDSDKADRVLMRGQANALTDYRDILAARIAQPTTF